MLRFRLNGLHGRSKVLLLALFTILLVASVTRFALLTYEGEAELARLGMVIRIALIGTLYDLAAASWILIPFALSASSALPWRHRARALSPG